MTAAAYCGVLIGGTSATRCICPSTSAPGGCHPTSSCSRETTGVAPRPFSLSPAPESRAGRRGLDQTARASISCLSQAASFGRSLPLRGLGTDGQRTHVTGRSADGIRDRLETGNGKHAGGRSGGGATCASVADHPTDSANGSKTVPALGVENVVIIGSGPAGYTAAIYASRANLKPVLLEGVQAGGVAGGQLMTTTEVENFPGFPEGITGPDLMERMRKQAERWGSEIHTEDVEEVDLQSRPFRVKTGEREIWTHSLIIATGAVAKRLGLPREHEFWSRGISACAICDGASPIFKNKELAVVGGGDTAAEEAIYLTKYAKHVHLLARGETLRASKAMQDRLFTNPNVTVHFHTEAVDVLSDDKGQMAGLQLKNLSTSALSPLSVRGLFYGIGHQPNSGFLRGQLELDAAGYVLVKDGSAATSVSGVFAAGDLQDHEWRQAVTAAGSGCMAALSAERFLTANDLLVEFHQVQVKEVEKKPELSKEDVEENFDLTLTRHKGQYALRKLYHESPRLLGVLYTSPTCGPCRSLKPILSKVIDEFPNMVHWVEIDIEEDPEIAEAAGIMGTPVVQFFKNKEKIRDISGVKMKSAYRELISSHV